MRLSGHQWLVVVLLDIVIRAICFVAFSFNVALILFAIPLSIIHIIILIITNYSTASISKSYRSAFVIATTNIIFCVVFIFTWISGIKNGHQTACVGYDYKCDWIDGVITSTGVGTIALVTF